MVDSVIYKKLQLNIVDNFKIRKHKKELLAKRTSDDANCFNYLKTCLNSARKTYNSKEN